MAPSSATGEYRAMQLSDLVREIKAQELLVEQVRLSIGLKKEKDTAKLRRSRRTLARMKTEWARKTATPLQGSAKPSTVSASAAPVTDKPAPKTRRTPSQKNA